MLTLLSFHSVRGGVGRSTAACNAAIYAARKSDNVYLIELDVSGSTSIVDRGCLCAPRWPGQTVNRDLLEKGNPTAFWRTGETTERIRARAALQKIEPATDRFVPFLNDYILHATTDWDGDHDAQLSGLLWRYAFGATGFFHVIPASPLPVDVHSIEPVVADEHHSGFIEARLERLIAAIASTGNATVVLDCPRGFHGLARMALSLGIRLSMEPKVSLAMDSYVPAPLDVTPVIWEATALYQGPHGKIGLERWLSVFTDDERSHVKAVETQPGSYHSVEDLRD